MKSPSTSDQSRGHACRQAGFSLIEIIIAMGILIMLLGISTPFLVSYYQRYQLDVERSAFVSYLRQARSLSMDGRGTNNHGVYIASAQFTVYEGTNYATRLTAKDQIFARSESVTITGPSEIIFKYLSGNASSVSYTLASPTKTGKIKINIEGRIDYE